MSPSIASTSIPDTASMTFTMGLHARHAARNTTYTTFTSGLAPSYIQANLLVLPSRYANDFRLLCQRNPVPCPLLAESSSVGKWDSLTSRIPTVAPDGAAIAADVDLRRDAPRYMVYQDGKLTKFETLDVAQEWTKDHVGFLIGCSYSFESALCAAGLPPRQITMQRNVPMYRTNIPLCPAGVFGGSTYVVSMRPYRLSQVEEVRDVTRPFVATHGEPVAWGWDAVRQLGIRDLSQPEWGDCALTLDGRPFTQEEEEDGVVPVFWGCGVTPQEAVMRANLKGTVMAHAPGHMIILDIREGDIILKG